MNTRFLYCVYALILHLNVLLGQNSRLHIKKVQGNFVKAIALPAKLRIIKHNDAVVKLKLDSIVNDKFYGNNGRDTLLITEIATVHLAGIKETAKYAALVTSTVASIGVAIFTYQIFSNTAFKCDLDNLTGCNIESYKIAGIAYSVGFAGISTLLCIRPKTRYSTKKFTFKTQ